MREIKFRGKGIASNDYCYGIGYADGVIFAPVGRNTIRYHVDPDSVAQLIGHDAEGKEIYEGDIYFDVDTQTQTHAPCIDELVNEALGDNFVSLNYYEMERAKKTLVEATP